MSDPLASQLSAFKKSIRNSSTTMPLQKRIVENGKQAARQGVKRGIKSSPSDTDYDSDSKRSKLAADYASEDVGRAGDENNDAEGDSEDTPGSSLSIRLMMASDFIKSSDRPVKVEELQRYMKTRVDPKLLKCLANVDRIKYDPVSKTLEYLSLHNIKTGEDLLKVLENQPTFQGLSVKQLKDGWNGCLETIAELEKENKIIVHKTKKENSPRHIWLNIGSVKMGGLVEDEFYDIWSRVKVPRGEDLTLKLLENGLKPTNVDPDSIKNKKAAPVQERKQKRARRGKITNTHMKGILKDYSKGV